MLLKLYQPKCALPFGNYEKEKEKKKRAVKSWPPPAMDLDPSCSVLHAILSCICPSDGGTIFYLVKKKKKGGTKEGRLDWVSGVV